MRSARDQFAAISTIAWMAVPLALAPAGPAAAASHHPTVLALGQAAKQDVPAAPGSEPDTLVEPDIAASPLDPGIAVAAAHDGRYPNGGAVGITHAWTRDGGLTWRHAPVRFITTAAGGAWDRASDPVLAFGPSGDVYLSTIALNSNEKDCRSAVLVSRSTDGGATFGRPVAAQYTNDCDIFNDKNWIAVDTGAHSPYRGRVYQFWAYFGPNTAQQRVRWSDDHGRTWSKAAVVTPGTASTQDSQVLIRPDGSLVDVYLDFAGSGRRPDRERETESERAAAAGPAPDAGVALRARISHNGGQTWSQAVTLATDVGGDVPGVRCCLPSAVIDPVSGQMHAVWESTDTSLLRATTSTDGVHWSVPVTVNNDRTSATQVVNADVAAYNGTVLVSYGVRDTATAGGRYVQQQTAISYDAGRSFDTRLRLGPRSDLNYAAEAGAKFPGDYVGTAVSRGRFYAAWMVSSTPPSGGTRHQVLLAAAIRP